MNITNHKYAVAALAALATAIVKYLSEAGGSNDRKDEEEGR